MPSTTERVSPTILGIATALPAFYEPQERLTAALREIWSRRHSNVRRFDQIQASLGITGRYIALPMEEYRPLDSFAKNNDAWIRVAPEIGARAITNALKSANV